MENLKGINCFTQEYEGLSNALITPCMISVAHKPSDKQTFSYKKVKALWDTGATATVITKQLAEELKLISFGTVKNYHANGFCMVNVYYVNILLPNNVGFAALRVTEGELNGIDILIGMDIISRGDFAVTSCQGKTKFTFQMPSTHDIDFSKENHNKQHTPVVSENKIGRNEPCICGSGKKYKHCCGKT